MTDAELDQCRRNGELLRSIIEEKVRLKRNAPLRWVGCCPFHDEKTASFTVYADGHFHCYGCSAHGTVFDFVMRRDGIEFRDAVKIIEEQLGFATGANPKRKPNNGADPHKDDDEFHAVIPPPKDAPAPLDQLNGRYQPFEYVTSQGETHHYQRRIDQGDGKKMFLPLTYGVLKGATGWHAKAPPQPWPLYRLDLLTSAAPDSWVIIVEGEGKCEAAERMFPDYVCTAWMNGAGSVDCSDWETLKRFREEHLIWWGDADRPGADGKPHGCFIAEPKFRKLFPRASYIDTSGLSDRKDGYDAKDLEADLGDEDPEAWLKARLRTTPPSGGATSGGGRPGADDGPDAPPPPPPPPPGGAPIPPGSLRLQFGIEALTPVAANTIVKGVLHRRSITLLYGPPKSGKSFLATDLALAIAAGDEKWMGCAIMSPGPVLYVACEGHAGYWKRLQAWHKHFGGEFPANFILATGRPALIAADQSGRLFAPNPQAILDALAACKARGIAPVAVFVDTVFRSFGPGNVNASDHMNAYLAALAEITDRDIAVCAIHHEIKSGGTPAGSVSLIGGSDTIIHVWREEGDEEEEGIGQRYWQIEFAKDDAENQPQPFDLVVVPLDPDPEGQPASSCAVAADTNEPPDKPKPRHAKTGRARSSTRPVGMTDDCMIALKALDRAISDASFADLLLKGFPRASGKPVVDIDLWRRCYMHMTEEPPDKEQTSDEKRQSNKIRNQEFHRARKRLITLGVVITEGKGVWKP